MIERIENSRGADGPAVGAHRVLHVSKRKWLGVLAICAVFVAIGLAMVIAKGDFLAWFTTLFFGLGASVAALQLTGASAQLELNADSFSVSSFGRTTTERWDECANFAVYRLTRTEQVVYDRARDVETHMGEMNRSISGRSAGLPDTFSMSADDLAQLMTAYQRHGVERSWKAHAPAVQACAARVTSDLLEAGVAAQVISDHAAMNLPAGMTTWPSVLAIAERPRSDGTRHVLICADVLSPTSRWITDEAKNEQAFDLLRADALHIIDPDTKDVRRIVRDVP